MPGRPATFGSASCYAAPSLPFGVQLIPLDDLSVARYQRHQVNAEQLVAIDEVFLDHFGQANVLSEIEK